MSTKPSQYCLHFNPNPPSTVSKSKQTLPTLSTLKPKPSQYCLHVKPNPPKSCFYFSPNPPNPVSIHFCSSPSQSCVRVRSNPPNHSSIVCLHFRPNPPNPVATSVRLFLSPTANVEIQFTHLIRRPKCWSCFALCFQATASFFFFFFLFFLFSFSSLSGNIVAWSFKVNVILCVGWGWWRGGGGGVDSE